VRKLERALEELRHANKQLASEHSQREYANLQRVKLQEQIIAVQRDRLTELAAPLIPIMNGLMVMTLVGTIDAERAGHAVETALCGASKRGARHLIIDITGVKRVDATVASMLIHAARGLKLLGTHAIITGIRAEIAQTLVMLDVRLDSIVTQSTLQAGIEYALQERGRRSTPHPT
jgi:anti-anti-sigma regulatory factor